MVQVAVGGLLCLLSLPLGIWIGTAGLMLGGLAGGVRLLPTFGGKGNKYSQNKGLRLKTFRQIHIRNRNHARAYRRSSSRPAFTGGGSDDSDGGSDSDQGDPPKHSLSFVIPFIIFSKIKKTNNFSSSRHLH